MNKKKLTIKNLSDYYVNRIERIVYFLNKISDDYVDISEQKMRKPGEGDNLFIHIFNAAIYLGLDLLDQGKQCLKEIKQALDIPIEMIVEKIEYFDAVSPLCCYSPVKKSAEETVNHLQALSEKFRQLCHDFYQQYVELEKAGGTFKTQIPRVVNVYLCGLLEGRLNTIYKITILYLKIVTKTEMADLTVEQLNNQLKKIGEEIEKTVEYRLELKDHHYLLICLWQASYYLHQLKEMVTEEEKEVIEKKCINYAYSITGIISQLEEFESNKKIPIYFVSKRLEKMIYKLILTSFEEESFCYLCYPPIQQARPLLTPVELNVNKNSVI